MLQLFVLLYFADDAEPADVDTFLADAPGVLGAAADEGLFESVHCGPGVGEVGGGADFAFGASLTSPEAARRWFASERHEDMSRLLRPIMRSASHVQIPV